MSKRTLLEGYRKIIENIYTPEAFFGRARQSLAFLPTADSLAGRIRIFLRLYRLQNINNLPLHRRLALMLRVLRALPAEFRTQSLRFLYKVAGERPELLPEAFSFVALALHFCQFSEEHVLPELKAELESLPL